MTEEQKKLLEDAGFEIVEREMHNYPDSRLMQYRLTVNGRRCRSGVSVCRRIGCPDEEQMREDCVRQLQENAIKVLQAGAMMGPETDDGYRRVDLYADT